MITKTLLLNQLGSLRETMAREEHWKAGATLNMPSWVHSVNTTPEGEFDCGTAACVCGHQALTLDFEFFPNAQRTFHGIKKIQLGLLLGRNAFGALGEDVGLDLTETCAKYFNKGYLADSIIDGNAESRLTHAKASGLFTSLEIATLKHLNLDKPTPQDVVDYLDLCIERVRDYLVEAVCV